MSTVAFEVFLPEVLPYIPSCPDTIAVNAIRNAVIEFCAQSYAWLVDNDPLTLLANVAEYDLDKPTQSEVVNIVQATVGTRPILPRSTDEMVRLYSTSWQQRKGSPMYFQRLRPDEVLRLIPCPDAAFAALGEKLNVRVALQPARTATGCDNLLYDTWLEELAAGARARIFALTGQSFYNPSEAMVQGRIFSRAITDAKIEFNKSNVRTDMRVSYVPI
jgi:hypothetical protein